MSEIQKPKSAEPEKQNKIAESKEKQDAKKYIEHRIALQRMPLKAPDEIRKHLRTQETVKKESHILTKQKEISEYYQLQARDIAEMHLQKAEIDLARMQRNGIGSPFELLKNLEKTEDISKLPEEQKREILSVIKQERYLLEQLPVIMKEATTMDAEREKIFSHATQKQIDLMNEWKKSYEESPNSAWKKYTTLYGEYTRYCDELRKESPLPTSEQDNVFQQALVLLNAETIRKIYAKTDLEAAQLIAEKPLSTKTYKDVLPVIQPIETGRKIQILTHEYKNELRELDEVLTKKKNAESVHKQMLYSVLQHRIAASQTYDKNVPFYDEKTKSYNPLLIAHYCRNINPEIKLWNWDNYKTNRIFGSGPIPTETQYILPLDHKRRIDEILLYLRSAEHLAISGDIRIGSIRADTERQWHSNVHILTHIEQDKIAQSSWLGMYYELTAGKMKSIGEVIQSMQKLDQNRQVNNPFPSDAFTLNSPDKDQYILVIEGMNGRAVNMHKTHLRSAIKNMPEEHLIAKPYTDMETIKKDIAEFILSIDKQNASPDKKPAEVLIFIDAHGTTTRSKKPTHTESMPEPLQDYQGSREGVIHLNNFFEMHEKELQEAVNPLGKKAKVYIIVDTCHGGAWQE